MFLLTIIFAWQANGQSLVDAYKTGSVSLVPVQGFAAETNWSKIFPDYNTDDYHNPIGMYKSIAIAPDGSVFVGNYSTYNIHKFDSNGKLILTFGKKGKGEEDFQERPTLGGVVGGKYVFTHEHNGKIKLFTLDGKYAKTLTLDYMPIKTIALTSNKIAAIGHVPMNGNVRYVITIIDPETGEQKIIRKYDNLWVNSGLTITNDKGMFSISPAFSRNEIIIRSLPDGNLLLGINTQNNMEVISPSGEQVKSFKLDFTPPSYPEELKSEFVSNIETSVSEGKFTKKDAAPVYEEDFFPKNTPYFYNLLIDSDGNLLVFRFIDEDVEHKFRVYSFDSNGKNIAEATLEIPGFKLSLNNRFEELVFDKGKAIGFLKPEGENTTGQLVKFEVKGK